MSRGDLEKRLAQANTPLPRMDGREIKDFGTITRG